MKILALDTSGPNCSVAILEDSKLLGDFTINNGVTHSQNLVPMIEQLQKFANVELSEIDAFACSIGPGSFTGLRIGLATVKGFALSLQKKVIAVPTLLALAHQVSYFDGVICSILDARNDNVYAGLYQKQNGRLTLMGDYISDSITTLISVINAQPIETPILFVGDGCIPYRERLVNALPKTLLFAESYLNAPTAHSVARTAMEMASFDEYSDYHALAPLYLKKSQAERMLDK